MKAWMVGTDNIDGVWLIHAESPGMAKTLAKHHTDLGDFDPEYVDLRARRCPELDNLPLTINHVEKVLNFPSAVDEDGNPYTGEYCTREDYRNGCPCPICKV